MSTHLRLLGHSSSIVYRILSSVDLLRAIEYEELGLTYTIDQFLTEKELKVKQTSDLTEV